MQGKKTHEQHKRMLERKPGPEDSDEAGENAGRAVHRPEARSSEFPVSRGGLNQESDHNKHNDPGQGGHKPQKHGPAEEKQ